MTDSENDIFGGRVPGKQLPSRGDETPKSPFTPAVDTDDVCLSVEQASGPVFERPDDSFQKDIETIDGQRHTRHLVRGTCSFVALALIASGGWLAYEKREWISNKMRGLSDGDRSGEVNRLIKEKQTLAEQNTAYQQRLEEYQDKGAMIPVDWRSLEFEQAISVSVPVEVGGEKGTLETKLYEHKTEGGRRAFSFTDKDGKPVFEKVHVHFSEGDTEHSGKMIYNCKEMGYPSVRIRSEKDGSLKEVQVVGVEVLWQKHSHTGQIRVQPRFFLAQGGIEKVEFDPGKRYESGEVKLPPQTHSTPDLP